MALEPGLKGEVLLRIMKKQDGAISTLWHVEGEVDIGDVNLGIDLLKGMFLEQAKKAEGIPGLRPRRV